MDIYFLKIQKQDIDTYALHPNEAKKKSLRLNRLFVFTGGGDTDRARAGAGRRPLLTCRRLSCLYRGGALPGQLLA
jgi:hypothetical protein